MIDVMQHVLKRYSGVIEGETENTAVICHVALSFLPQCVLFAVHR